MPKDRRAVGQAIATHIAATAGGPQGAAMQVRSLTGTWCRQTLFCCLGAATWACALAPIQVSAQDRHGESDRAEDSRVTRQQPPTVLATPPFTVRRTQLADCFLVNLGSAPLSVTQTIRTDDGSPPHITTGLVPPNLANGVERSINTGQDVQMSCEFQASDVSLLRGSGVVTQSFSNHPVLQIIPAN